jgi:hypothetical protein
MYDQRDDWKRLDALADMSLGEHSLPKDAIVT